jgi:hypothetical protein
MKKTCKFLLETYRQRKLDCETLKRIGNTPFGSALLSIGLARIENRKYLLKGDGLLLNEMKKIKTDDDFEKVARLILRYEQAKQAKVSSVIACLESLERSTHPTKSPIGSAPRFWKSKRTGNRYERLGYYDLVSGICSFDTRVTADILGKSDPYDGFVTFGAFIDTFYRTYKKNGEEWSDTFSFLSWYTDSLAYLALSEDELKEANFPRFKFEKTRRHRAFLKRFISEDTFKIASPKKSFEISTRSPRSEIVEMNIAPEKLAQCGIHEVEYCSSNVYVASDVPVDRELFESTVLNVLQEPSMFKDSQGAFYYPDFRFLVASTIGLSLKSVDQILAYVLSTSPELSRRLWFYPAFGNVARRDRPDEQLMEVVQKPFDSITLTY